MAIEEARRLQLHTAARERLGEAEGDTLMEMLPPAGDEAATRRDIELQAVISRGRVEATEGRLRQEIIPAEAGIRQQITQTEARLDQRITESEARTRRDLEASIVATRDDLRDRITATAAKLDLVERKVTGHVDRTALELAGLFLVLLSIATGLIMWAA